MSDKNIPNDKNHLNINDESLFSADKKSQDSINSNDASDYEDEGLHTANVKKDFIDNILNPNLTNQFIKIIDIDDLTPDELLRIIVAVGSKNMAYYLALIVNLENRSRKISPLGIAKILSSKSVNAPSSNPEKTYSPIEKMTPGKNFNNIP
jgi:hypothetical protein